MNKQENKKIYVSVWGATMRMVDFYRVIKETEKTVVLRKLVEKTVENCGYLTGRVVPTEEDYKYFDKYEEVRAYKHNGVALRETLFSRKDGYYKSFVLWDNKPVYFDHCD